MFVLCAFWYTIPLGLLNVLVNTPTIRHIVTMLSTPTSQFESKLEAILAGADLSPAEIRTWQTVARVVTVETLSQVVDALERFPEFIRPFTTVLENFELVQTNRQPDTTARYSQAVSNFFQQQVENIFPNHVD